MRGERMLRDAFSELNPFVCLGFYAAVIAISAGVLHPFILVASLIGWLLVTWCRKGLRETVKRILRMLPLALFTAIVNPLFSHGGVTILTYLPTGNPLTLESLLYGLAAGMMMLNTLGWFLNLSEMMTGEKWIYLFGRTIPALSLVLSMIFRFVPKLLRQIKQTHDALRLSEPVSDRKKDKLKLALHTFSAVVSWALEDAAQTADSMRCRGYGKTGRTIYSRYGFDARDGILLAVILGLAIPAFLNRPEWGYFPALYMEQQITGGTFFLLLCIVPAVFGFCMDIRYGMRIRRVSK